MKSMNLVVKKKLSKVLACTGEHDFTVFVSPVVSLYQNIGILYNVL